MRIGKGVQCVLKLNLYVRYNLEKKPIQAQAAGNGVDPAQKRTRPKHAFSGPEPPRDQRLLMSFRRVRQGRTNVFEKKLFGY